MGAHTIVSGALLAATCVASSACKQPGKYAGDNDTGAAAPATKTNVSETHGAGDSAAGTASPVTRATVAGDTTGRRGPTGTPGPGTKKRPEP